MFRKPILISILTLGLASLACQAAAPDMPITKVTTGPTETTEIAVPFPDADSVELTLTFGAGELKIQPDGKELLVEGLATYNVLDFKPQINIDGNKVSVETGDLDIKGIPNLGDDIKNKWDLKLGNMPMRLSLNAGAYEGNIDLGGLALESLDVADGAADLELEFSQPNPAEMTTLRYTTGASNVKLKGLANANFLSMIFRCGAGDYTLDFSGGLKRDAAVTIEAGLSQVIIIVPQGTSAQVIFNGGLTNIDVSDEWQISDKTYTLAGSGPTLTINVDMGAGNLELRTE